MLEAGLIPDGGRLALASYAMLPLSKFTPIKPVEESKSKVWMVRLTCGGFENNVRFLVTALVL